MRRRSSSYPHLLNFILTFLGILTLIGNVANGLAQETQGQKYADQNCLDCHSDPELKSGSGKSIFVDVGVLGHSVHTGVGCFDCHNQKGANFDDVPHFTALQPVACENCHPRTAAVWMEYFYKMLDKIGRKDIPNCKDCHGAHDGQKQMSMVIVCDRCHTEIAQKYRQSYHFKKYQEDTRKYPICTTCHDPHFKSKKEMMSEVEFKQEIVDICSRCHQRDIETYIHSRHFHELEGGNTKAPVCTNCHENHDIRKPSDPESRVNASNISDVCNNCHPGHKESLHRGPGVNPALISCATCHTGHQTDMASISHEIFKEGGIFNRCNYCHSSERHSKENLAHGTLMLIDPSGKEANCTECHIYHWNLPGLDNQQIKHKRTECVNCHAQQNREYKRSIHGRARAQGITAAPTCTDCHGEKDILKTSQQFTPEGIIELCSKCHSNKELMLKFQINPYVVEGYKDTYHGKLFETGTRDIKFAVCTNCHGSHTILAPGDPESMVNRGHIVETCKQCHPRANDRFVSYLVHPKKPTEGELQEGAKMAMADSSMAGVRTNSERYGQGTGWLGFNNLVTAAMSLLLAIVLGVFGFHTFLWFQRGIRGRFRPKGIYYRRIDGFSRFLHILVNISFLTLAFTGLPQSYAHTELAKWMFRHIISLQTAQKLHYLGALITGLYFALHLGYLGLKWRKLGWRKMLTGPDTLSFRMKDIKDFRDHLRWFFGKGPHPKFDRWTYWEKFDYFAVFWGVFVIGLSGLMRWQEEFFGNLLGGGVISLADTIHKEEALLATAFIFIIHFFNTHLRADKFPMDVSIYTGRITEDDFRNERPLEWDRLQDEGRLQELRLKPLGTFTTFLGYAWGTIALLIGLFLLALIVIGQFTVK